MNGWLKLARHELFIAIKTRRLMLVSVAYIVAAIGGSLLYALVLRQIEAVALEAMGENGLDPVRAAAALTLTSQSAYQQMTAFFAGVSLEELSPTLARSAPVPVYFWSSLTFLPFLVTLTSFDVIQSRLQGRTFCFVSLRVPRRAVLLGKFVAHLTMQTIISGLAALAFVITTAALLSSVTVASALPGIAWVWLCLIPVGAAYLALSFAASTLTTRALGALAMSVGSVMLLRIFYWLGAIPEDSAWSGLRLLRWLSPVQFQDELWLAGWLAPLGGVVVFLIFGLTFLVVADARLQRRDL